MNAFAKIAVFVFIILSSFHLLGQDLRIVKVKLLNKDMQPQKGITFSLDQNQKHTVNDQGIAIIKIDDTKLPPQNIRIYDEDIEAESWNYSRGILEIIIRKRTSKIVTGTVIGVNNNPMANFQFVITSIGKIVTNESGDFKVTAKLDFNFNNKAIYQISEFDIQQIVVENNKLNIYLKSLPEEEIAEVKLGPKYVQPPSEVVINQDSTIDINDFYQYLQGISLEDLNNEQQEDLDAVYNALIGYYEDSLRTNFINSMPEITGASNISLDLEVLIKRAEIEQKIATQSSQIFAKKMDLINEKITSDDLYLTESDKNALVRDLEILNNILQKNKKLFQQNQTDYQSILISINKNLLKISDLEEKLSLSEQMLEEQQQIFEKRTSLYIIGLTFLIVFLVVVVFFLTRFRRQKKEIVVAYDQIRNLNEHLEELVKERTIKLESTNEELDIFLYKSAHNLRGPLLTIVGLSEVAKLTLDKDGLELFNKTENIVATMDQMLKKLIMVSNINHPSLPSNFNINQLVKNIEAKFKTLITNTPIKLKKEICNDDFYSHDFLIEIIIGNLLENAFKFSLLSNDIPKVKLEINISDDFLMIKVSDNGNGIAPNVKDKIWEMFYLGNEISSGNGLGLYVTKKAVDTLDGHISYIRTGDDLTVFEVRIPSAARD